MDVQAGDQRIYLRSITRPPRTPLSTTATARSRGPVTEDSRWSTLARMVARVWHGYTTRANADVYEAMLKPELLPGLSSACWISPKADAPPDGG